MTTSSNFDSITFDSFGEVTTIFPYLDRYANGRACIKFTCDEGPFGTLTTNIPDAHLNEDEVLVKDWSENEGLVAALLAEGWLIDTGREIASGFVFPKVMRPAGALLEFIRGED